MTEAATAIGVEIDANPRTSAVSWGAVIAGALIATAVTFALMVLGAGLGLTLVSPWWEGNADATTIAASTVVWLVVMQWASAGIGGYLTGRLRTRWTSVHSDEVFFRDTAHGFLAWALATIIVVGFASLGLMGALSAGTQAVGQAAGAAVEGASEAASESVTDPTAYFVDALYRPESLPTSDAASAEDQPAAPSADAPSPAPAAPGTASTPAPANVPSIPTASAASRPSAAVPGPSSDANRIRAETTRIILRGMTAETFPDDDRSYLAQLVATETGLSRDEAEARVDTVLQGLNDAKAEAQAAAEEAREAAITLAVVSFVSLLVGAFIGAVAAALGGRHRDDWEVSLAGRPGDTLR
jgi:hypothetical protein